MNFNSFVNDLYDELDNIQNNNDKYYYKLVKNMRDNKNLEEMCENENDILKKCILCKTHLSSNKWSMILEKFIIKKFNLKKKLNNTSGDARSEKSNIEIKVSLGTKDGTYNLVQLRPDHDIDYYIILIYDMFVGDIGKIYWFLCPSKKLYNLLPKYGGYSHGTIKELGKITKENIYNRNREYSLRPNSIKNDKTKPKKLWNIMVETFLCTEEDIINNI